MSNPPDSPTDAVSEPFASDPALPGDNRLFVQQSSPINIALVAASVLLTVWTGFGATQIRLLPWRISLAPAHSPLWLIEVRQGQVWRLITPIFLHFSIAHLGFNMLGMFSLGNILERRIGSATFLGGTMAIALASNLSQYFFAGDPGFGGMSGVLYGLFGYVWLRAYLDRTFGLSMPKESIVMALGWYVLCFTGKLGDIANTAHTAGLILGALWGVADARAAMRGVRTAAIMH